jgi:DNA end-binding protein Ku
MARALWSGSISFGLVNVPVKAYTAVRDHSVHFHQLDRKSGARVRYEKVSEKSGKEVAPAYRLLGVAMEHTGRAGIGSVVMRNTQYLAAIRPLDGGLAMSTMRFADEVVPKSSIDQVPSGGHNPAAKELYLAEQIIDSLATEWDPSRYHDTFTEEVEDLLHRKAKGERVVVEEAPAHETKVVEMAALEASIAVAKKAAPTRPARKRSAKASPAARPARARAEKGQARRKGA